MGWDDPSDTDHPFLVHALPAYSRNSYDAISGLGVIFIPPILASSIAETAQVVANEMLTPMITQGFILGFIGLGMVIVGLFLARGGRSVSPY